LGFNGKGGALLGIFVFRRNQAYSGVILDGSKDFYTEFIANRGAVRRLPGEGTIGKSFLIHNIPVRSIFASYLIRVIPSSNISSQYLKRFFESPYYWKQLYDAAWGAGQPNVNGTSLSNLILPLPPLEEQKMVVKRLDDLMIIIDELEKQVTDRKDQSEMLIQSVLQEAFAE
jgi:restriction endonuclease S subunit